MADPGLRIQKSQCFGLASSLVSFDMAYIYIYMIFWREIANIFGSMLVNVCYILSIILHYGLSLALFAI